MGDSLDEAPPAWGPLPPLENPTILEGAGLVCETARFDSFYDASGNRVVLATGKKYKNKDRNFKSALTVTTYWDKHQDIQNTELEIRSPHMKAALKAVIPAYSSSNIDRKHIKFDEQPWCLFHYRKELMAYGKDIQTHNPIAAAHVYHLMIYMWDVFEVESISHTKWVEDCEDEPASEHRYLWMIFRPGDVIFVQATCQAFVFRYMWLIDCTWNLYGYHIAYDGVDYGPTSYRVSIGPYDGVKSLRELAAVPFDRLSDSKQRALRQRLVARGRKFIGIHGFQYLWYDGKHHDRQWARTSQHMMKCRIVADCEGYDEGGFNRKVTFLDNKKKFNASSAQSDMTEDDLMICNTGVKGYSLRDNRWEIFEVDSISNIAFDSEAFDALMIQEDQKRQILALVRVHEDERLKFDDLVKGKGRGMVFLLYGDPGTGKTLTAESVSDYCKKPLLRLDASTLGTSVSSVESGLTKTFKLAEKWQALVLLDEADIYLEQRKSKNLTHNGLVSVFLRMLEYYEGVLFLTTNRIKSFDRAFMSRIHLALYYPSLTQASRRELWYTFLKRCSPESAEELRHNGALDELAEECLNGRQIKNIVRTASALSLSGGPSSDGHIYRKHIEWALGPMKSFESHMARVFSDEEERDRNHRERSGVSDQENQDLDQENADDGESDVSPYEEEDENEEEESQAESSDREIYIGSDEDEGENEEDESQEESSDREIYVGPDGDKGKNEGEESQEESSDDEFSYPANKRIRTH